MRHVAHDTKPLSEPVVLILTSLASEAKHGYALLKDVEKLSEGRVQLSTGTLYGAIRRLLEDGWIERFEQEDTSRDKQAYRLTAKGRAQLHYEIARLRHLLQSAAVRLGLKGAWVRLSISFRALLLLYPADFRRQFSAEMLCVFEQRAGEVFANGKSATFAFLLTEFFSIVKGAYTMWFARMLRINRNRLPSQPTSSNLEPLTFAEATKQRETAIRNMVASIARHDFSNARRYSDEETRLKNLIHDLARDSRQITPPLSQLSA
jgi:DNA-binding PadR family transcriptional regulator